MLLELRVENYALIDNVAVEFSPGLNLLTGETGAGKSILIDALALLLGNKASSDVVRHGAEKAVVSSVFQVEGDRAARILEENGVDADTEEIILRREILATGKGRAFINNQLVTVSVLRLLAPELASIHAQNETVLAFDASARLKLLDGYAGTQLGDIRSHFKEWNALRSHIVDLEKDEQDRLKLVDLWSFQVREIGAAHLKSKEDEQLETEKRVLANAEKLRSAAMGAYDLLYDSNTSVAASLRVAARHLEELLRYEPKFQEQLAVLESARATVQDVSATLREYSDAIDASPERLAEVEDRLALLDRLKRKYGSDIDEVIAYGLELARKLNEIENRDQVLTQLRKELNLAGEKYLQTAQTLSKARHQAAKKLEKLVETQINELAMKAKFDIEVRSSEGESDWSASGLDSVVYNIATNAGEPLKPIEQIASGGELSRVMLALKVSIEQGGGEGQHNGRARGRSRIPRTLVFDEIDTGIGGRAAEAVGTKLKALSRNNQVLCITHLPQIASFADRHFVIEKKETGGRTKTSVRGLEVRERAEEIARMLSGAKVTEASLRHAEQMLKANA